MLCHHHKTIFVHIPKNAGQSIERVFLELVGLEWATRAALLLRANDEPRLGPPRLAHLTAEEYVQCKYATQEMFDSYFKFAVVRNPWERAVSFYKYLQFQGRCDFPTFVGGIFREYIFENQHWFVRPQCDFVVSESGELLVDFVMRFEALQSDFDAVCQRAGIPQTRLPRVNVSRSHSASPLQFDKQTLKRFNLARANREFSRRDSWREHYDRTSQSAIADLYREDIDRFGYTFD